MTCLCGACAMGTPLEDATAVAVAVCSEREQFPASNPVVLLLSLLTPCWCFAPISHPLCYAFIYGFLAFLLEFACCDCHSLCTPVCLPPSPRALVVGHSEHTVALACCERVSCVFLSVCSPVPLAPGVVRASGGVVSTCGVWDSSPARTSATTVRKATHCVLNPAAACFCCVA